MSSISALKTIENRPHTAKALTFKLHEDVRNGVLVSLDDFLKLPEVKESGINKSNCHKYIIPSPIHLVTNQNSSSTPLRMTVAPNCTNKLTNKSINNMIHTGVHVLPTIQSVLLRYQFAYQI